MARLPHRSTQALVPYNVQRLRQGRDYVIPVCPSDSFSSNCFDVINQESYDIYDYLNATDIDNRREREREKKKRMIFFYGEDLDHVKPYCYHTDYIERIDPLTNIYTVDCRKHPVTGNYFGTSAGSQLALPILKLDLEFSVYVYLHHFMEVLRGDNRIFLIIPSEVEHERTASVGTLDYTIDGQPNNDLQRYVGADHCQEGTNKRICSIYVCPRDVIDEYLKEDRMPLNVRYSNIRGVKSRKSRKSRVPQSRMRRVERSNSEDVPLNIRFSRKSRRSSTSRKSRKPRVSASPKSRVSVSRKPRASASRKPRVSASRKPRASASRKPRVSASRKPRASASRKPRASASRKTRVSVSRKPRKPRGLNID